MNIPSLMQTALGLGMQVFTMDEVDEQPVPFVDGLNLFTNGINLTTNAPCTSDVCQGRRQQFRLYVYERQVECEGCGYRAMTESEATQTALILEQLSQAAVA